MWRILLKNINIYLTKLKWLFPEKCKAIKNSCSTFTTNDSLTYRSQVSQCYLLGYEAVLALSVITHKIIICIFITVKMSNFITSIITKIRFITALLMQTKTYSNSASEGTYLKYKNLLHFKNFYLIQNIINSSLLQIWP
jgi:hypothetical protein